MQLIPTQEELAQLLRSTGALRDGHFDYANGVHTDQHVDPILAMRSYQNAKILNVALSRKLRAQKDLIANMRDLAIVAATPNGLPIAYGLSYVLAPRRVYWVEKPGRDAKMAFRPFTEPAPGEKIILVDDILRAGRLLAEAKELIESCKAEVVAIAVIARQPTPITRRFDVPVFSAIELEPRAYMDKESCELCKAGIPAVSIEQPFKGPKPQTDAQPSPAVQQ